MELLYEICKWAAILLTTFSAPLMVWTLVTALRGFGKPKELKREENTLHRFAVVVCARNEENVIGNLLQSLQKQDYAGGYHIFVVADNCTDGTAAIAEQHSATVFRRTDPDRRGKGYALHYGLSRILSTYRDAYDAVCVFDADNLASAGFLTEMNAALCSGAHVALGYRDSKNIHDSWISEVYSLYWLMLMRFYHTPRHAMGLSSMVGGTGFAFKTSALGKEGWVTQSLTEDVEFSIQQMLAGHKILPARKAVYYDEQPATFDVSVKQRMRWMSGGLQCIPLYLPRILRAAVHGNLKALDLTWYLLFIPATGLALPLNALTCAAMLLDPATQPFALPILLGGMVISYLFPLFIAYATLKLEKRGIRPMRRAILLYPLFMLTMMLVALGALARPNTEWVPIRHESRCSIEEMK